jgi:hypothetical protein
VAIGIHATRLPKNKGETGKKLVEDFFLRGSLGYHPGGMNVKCAVAGDGYNQKAGTVKRQDEDEAKCSLPDINALMDVELPESSGTPITASGKPTSLDLPDSSTENGKGCNVQVTWISWRDYHGLRLRPLSLYVQIQASDCYKFVSTNRFSSHSAV